MEEKITEWTKIEGEMRKKLKAFFERGMTCVGSPLIQEASAETGLDTSVVENWLGNYKRTFNFNRWSKLGTEDRQKYKEEAAALKANPKDFSPDMRALKIKRHMKQLVLKVSQLEELGVETAMLAVDRLNPEPSVIQIASKKAAVFLEETNTANSFAVKMSAPAA
ncbi:uncharacterized protein zgc:113176 [Acanthochromis polyacanthus]|uniref:uncharacterized protein zgc:113176 n=1 Tax=Acanthochromis polyacanthus TaxID=80966 RepID=UPI0022349B84|nr:uncharacterized protein zgc:113176 [Acanthochromis polyacanthus]